MRYLWLLFFGFVILISVIFTSQNMDMVTLRFQIDWLGIHFNTSKPLFLPIILSLVLGLLFSTLYFFLLHMQLRFSSRMKVHEIKRLKLLIQREREKVDGLEQQLQNRQDPTQQAEGSNGNMGNIRVVNPESTEVVSVNSGTTPLNMGHSFTDISPPLDSPLSKPTSPQLK